MSDSALFARQIGPDLIAQSYELVATTEDTMATNGPLDEEQVYEKGADLNRDESPESELPVTTGRTAPSSEVTVKRQSVSDIFTIICAGFALISDGYQNNLMTMTNVVLKKEYAKQYTSAYSTQVSNALLVGEILGQITIGLTCDYFGRKIAIVTTTAMIVIGGILATASSGVTIDGMFWMLTVRLNLSEFDTSIAHTSIDRSRRHWLRDGGRVSCQFHISI